MTLVGHRDREQITATYTVQKESRAGVPWLHVLWESNVDRIEGWLRPDGQPIRTIYDKYKSNEHIEIDYTEAGATFSYTKTQKTKTRQIRRANLVEVLLIDVLLLAYPFDTPAEIVFPIINSQSDSGDTYSMFAKLDAVEEVTVAGVKHQAYKIKLGVSGFVGLFGPTYYLWYAVAPPHRYLKYQGPDESYELKEGGLGVGARGVP